MKHQEKLRQAIGQANSDIENYCRQIQHIEKAVEITKQKVTVWEMQLRCSHDKAFSVTTADNIRQTVCPECCLLM